MNNVLKYFNKQELEFIKGIEDTYVKAYFIVERVFRDVLDKGGKPYLHHLYCVASKLDTKEERTVGLLHDTIEDTEINENDLREVGFNDTIINALLLVTKQADETYPQFIDRILNSGNMIAIKVKKADMENNMDLSRISNPTVKDYHRNEKKYAPQYKRIVSYIERKG